PTSDPLPPVRAIRAATDEVVGMLLDRGIATLLMTRGCVPRTLIGRLARSPGKVQVAVGITTADPVLSRRIEGRSASPRARLRSLSRLIAADVDVEVRLEPLIPDLTDSAANLRPLFAALAQAGARRV